MWTFLNLPDTVWDIKLSDLLYHWLMWHMLNIILQAPLSLSSACLLAWCVCSYIDYIHIQHVSTEAVHFDGEALWGSLVSQRLLRWSCFQSACLLVGCCAHRSQPQDVSVVLRETARWIGVYGWPQGLNRQQPGYRNVKSTWTCECGCSCSYFTPLESNQSSPLIYNLRGGLFCNLNFFFQSEMTFSQGCVF